MTSLAVLAFAAMLAWIGLLTARGGFWRCDQRLPAVTSEPGAWPAVVCVVPARNEAGSIGRAVVSLLGQNYPGALSVIVVDDESTDRTAEEARTAGATVLTGAPLPPGWTGKVWAQAQGVAHIAQHSPDAQWMLLTDADIAHAPDAVSSLIAKGEAESLNLVSLMVLLRCCSAWERLLIPPFVFFFQKLYPFRWVNDPARTAVAAAAGGCMLVRRAALEAAGGMAVIRDRLIDDCALAAHLKRNGPIWIGLSTRTHSLRAYETLSELWSMVARTAYTQLEYRPSLLVATVLGMVLLYLIPPIASIAGLATLTPAAGLAGAGGWFLMAVAMGPTAELYRQPFWRAGLLPIAGAMYTAMTVDSAIRHWRGRGSAWKGRRYGGLRAAGR